MSFSAVPRTSVDLFAGCGGLSLGLHRAGWKGVFAIEKDPMAFETLKRNLLVKGAPYKGFELWPEWLSKEPHDVEDLLADGAMRRRLAALEGKVGLVAGGPPCQGFSVGGRRNGEDARNQLVHRLLEVVGLVRSPLVLVENVEGIARRFVSKPGSARDVSVAEHVVEELGELDYDAAYSVVDASDFGVPQVRRRVLIVGMRRDLFPGEGAAELLPAVLEKVRRDMLRGMRLPRQRKITVREAIEDLCGEGRIVCPDSPGFDSATYREEPPSSSYGKLMRRGIESSEIPDSHRLSKHGDRIRAFYETAHATQPAGRLQKAFLLAQGTKKDKKVLLDAEAPASTITTHPDEFIHYREARNVTVREMARLQSFPDDFTFHGRYTINGPRRRYDVARCSQVGNAVPPLLARAVGLALLEVAAGGLEEHRPEESQEPLAETVAVGAGSGALVPVFS
jgi:DNA (cytosine-5)-methyltransferase 1